MTPETPSSAPRKQSVARNPKATHDYHVLETWETGIVLTGTEVKSLRSGKASIKEAYARLKNGEVFLEGMNITPYEQGNRYNHDPVRSRKLLLHRREIEKLIGAVEQRGLTLVPLELYELARRLTAGRGAVLVVNLAILLYLILRVRDKTGESATVLYTEEDTPAAG